MKSTRLTCRHLRQKTCSRRLLCEPRRGHAVLRSGVLCFSSAAFATTAMLGQLRGFTNNAVYNRSISPAARRSHVAVTADRHWQRQGACKLAPALRHQRCISCRANGATSQLKPDKQKMSIDLEPQAEGEYCMPGEVILDNESHELFTILRVEVKDYPGLLRVIAWVLNGLQLTVQNARCANMACCKLLRVSLLALPCLLGFS